MNKNDGKTYFCDNGLLNNFIFDPETKLLENMVAITLYKKYGDNLFYYNRNVEVDFFIPESHRAIQVSFSLADEITRKREIKALTKLSKIYQVDHFEIITWDEETVLEENGIVIHISPIWKWLLKEEEPKVISS